MLPNLEKFRKAHNVSQAKLAKAINSTQQSVNQHENQDIEPGIDMLKRIATYFCCSVDYITGNTNKKAPQPIDLTDEDEQMLIKHHRLTLKERARVNCLIDTFIENHD